MNSSTKKGLLILSLVVLSTLLVSCKDDVNKQANDKNIKKEIVNILTEEEKAPEVVSDKDAKFKMVMDEVHTMEHWAMSKVKEIYTDLEFVKQVSKIDEANLAWMSAEDWLYSEKYDVTVVVCNSMDTPAYVFNGKTLEWVELENTKKMMKEMMDMMMKDWEMMMMDHEDWMMMDDSKMTNSKGVYIDYSESALKDAKWDIVLFFHANWCPTCIATEKDILKQGVPDNLSILKANFDTELELRKKYWVTTQTTFVQVDNEWNMIKKWAWGKLADIVKKVSE